MKENEDDDFEEEDDFDDDEEYDEDGYSIVFRCPICHEANANCDHLLGSRDVHFAGFYGVDENGPLTSLSDLFEQLGEALSAAVANRPSKPHLRSVRPARLRMLLEEVVEGEENLSFTMYIEDLGNDTGRRVYSRSFIDEGGLPGFTSKVYLYWTRKPDRVRDEMEPRLRADIRRLAAFTKSAQPK